MARKDQHRPAEINPADYEYVAQEHVKIESLGDCVFMQQERAKIAAHMARTGGAYSHHVHGGNCAICGSINAVYTVLFYHRPTNTYIRAGQDCAAKLDSSYDGSEFRRNVKNALEAVAGKRKAEATLAAAGLSACWEIYKSSGSLPNEESIVRDIAGKLVRYGSISEKQMEFLRKLLGQIVERPQREAVEAAANAAIPDCPAAERMEIIGTVAALKVVEGFYGRQTKMLVISDAGWKVWGSRTANFEKGDYVSFSASVERSKDDPKFGFFKRPTKGLLLAEPLDRPH